MATCRHSPGVTVLLRRMTIAIDFIPARRLVASRARKHLLLEAVEVRVHDVQRHLHSIKSEPWAKAVSSIFEMGVGLLWPVNPM